MYIASRQDENDVTLAYLSQRNDVSRAVQNFNLIFKKLNFATEDSNHSSIVSGWRKFKNDGLFLYVSHDNKLDYQKSYHTTDDDL